MDSFKSLQDTISAALVSTTRSATRINGADIAFQRSLNPKLGTAVDAQNARLLQLAQCLLENAASSSDAVGPKLPDVEAIDGNWKGVVDIVDSLLEKADISLDEYTGVIKRMSPSGDQTAATSKSHFSSGLKHFAKPQLSFEHVPQNNETGGFRPLMTYKPHAKVPLAECMKAFKDSNGCEQFPHPYQTEIESYEYPPSMYEVAEPQPYPPFETTTASFVDTPEALAMMLAELKTAKEIAIDLEHHDNRTYVGMLSLMQISTRNKDWIVDTLKPWRRRLECLNEVFADPNVLKVLHGAYMDIVWLQRDLGLYVVGLFDTYHAARALGYPQASLAFLLDKFVNFKAQKQYRLADWRVRPLSDELFSYARADTHFLLHVFDHMRNELIERSNLEDPERNKIHDVLKNSKETALQRYEHPIYDSEFGLGSAGWYRLISRTPVHFNPEQFSVFRAVHKWRDDVARQQDESTLFIMPNHAVFSIARAMPLDKPTLFTVTQHVSPILREKADDLISVIARAKAAGENGPDLNDMLKKIAHIKFPAMESTKAPESAPSSTLAELELRTAPAIATLDTPAPRASLSRFWGSLLSGEASGQRRSASTLNVSLALPLPPLTAEIFAEPASVAAQSNIPQAEKLEHVFVPKEERPPEDQRTDIFIVKQLGAGHKRKRAAVENQVELSTDELDKVGPTNNGEADEIMLEGEVDELSRRKEKALRKAAKREAKKQKALLQSAENAGSLNDGDEEAAFDYTSAPSVLRAREVEAEQTKAGKKKKDKKKDPGFSPFSGLQDALKGLPRSQKEGPGRSRTFTS